MSQVFDQIKSMLNDIPSGNTPLASLVSINPKNCWPDGVAGYSIERNQMYFSVRINEMHLSKNRQWFTVFEPMVVIAVEFSYGQERISVPMVVGPNLIKKEMAGNEPKYGCILQDILIGGPYPYIGGDITVSVGLYRVERQNYARTLFNIVETLSSTFGGIGGLGGISKSGMALLEGVQGLLGLSGTLYLAGYKISAVTPPFDTLVAKFSALIAPPIPGNSNNFLVRDNRLYLEKIETEPVPYRDSDFVLTSITGTKERGDDNMFAFSSLKTDALLAIWQGENGIKRAKALLIVAYQEMRKSKDITLSEAERLFDSWTHEFHLELKRFETTNSLPLNAKPRQELKLTQELNSAVVKLAL